MKRGSKAIEGSESNESGRPSKRARVMQNEVALTEGVEALTGVAALNSVITDDDLVLSCYDENYSHVIFQGKIFLDRLGKHAQAQRISKYFLPVEPALLDKIRTACQAARIPIPQLEAIQEGVAPPKTLHDQQLTLPSPSTTKIRKTLEALKEKQNLEVVRSLSCQSQVRGSVKTTLQLLEVAAKFKYLRVIDDVLNHPDLSKAKAYFFDETVSFLASFGHIDLVNEYLDGKPYTPRLITALGSGIGYAAGHGTLEEVEKLLGIPELIAERFQWGANAICAAIERGNLSILEAFLKIQELRLYANTQNVLQTAVRNKNVEILKRLLMLFGERDPHYYSDLLKGVAREGQVEVLRSLLTISALRKKVTECFQTMVSEAASRGHVTFLQELMKHPEWKKIVREELPLFLAAVGSGQSELVNELWPKVQDKLPNSIKPMLDASVRGGNLEILQRLLNSAKGSPSQLDLGLFEAIKIGRLDMVRAFLGKSSFVPGVVFLNDAAIHGHAQIVAELLKCHAVRGENTWPTYIIGRLFDTFGYPSITPTSLQEWAKSWYEDALRGAVSHGHVEVVKIFLNEPRVRSQAALWSLEAVKTAIARHQIEALQELLNVPEIRSEVGSNDTVLNRAADVGDAEAVDELFKIDAIKVKAAAYGNEALRRASQKGHIDVVRKLLTCQTVIDAIDVDNNAIFKDAARNGHVLVVLALLQYPQVAANAAANNNFALRMAIQGKHIHVVNVLLKCPAVRKKLSPEMLFDILIDMPLVDRKNIEEIFASFGPEHCLSRQALLAIADRIRGEDQGSQLLLFKYLKRYGYDPVERSLPPIAALQASIEQSFSQPFADPRSHAGEILTLRAQAKEAKIPSYADLADDHESAMNDCLVKQANDRFGGKIKPFLTERFTSLEKIEPKIVAILINRKLAQLKAEGVERHREAIDFIEQNKDRLIARELEVMIQALPYFKATDDILEISFRALCAAAPSHNWQKLFVAPKKEQEKDTVFSTRAASVEALNLLQTTQIIRERLCYAYLAATDPALSPEQQEEVMKELFVHLAETSRGNNKRSDEMDNPRCFPGTITQLDLIFQKHPEFKVPHDLTITTQNIAGQLVVKAFDKALSTLPSAEAKLELYQALTLYSDLNALSVINQPETVIDTEGKSAKLERLLEIRKSFFKHYFGEGAVDGIAAINQKLIEDYELNLDEDTEVIALAALMNMGRASPSTTFSLTEAYQRATPLPEIKETAVVPKNPFAQSYGDIYIRLAKLLKEPQLQTKAKAQYTQMALKRAECECIYQGLVHANPEADAQVLMDEAQNTVDERFSEGKGTTYSDILSDLNQLLVPTGATMIYPTAEEIEAEIRGFQLPVAKPALLPQFSRQKVAKAVAPPEEDAMDLDEEIKLEGRFPS
ncbi:MAG: hypothetical protein ACHQJ6_06735 [Candidatus Berkiellales bacterium]